MSDQITTAHTKSFAAGIDLLQQQTGAQVAMGVDMDTITNADRQFYDQVDAVEMVDILDRHGDTQIVSVPHKRRMVVPSPSEVADYIDRDDVRRVLNDPQNAYVRSFASAANRKKDDKVIAAFFATASTGVDGSGSATFDTTNYSIASGSAGMTVAKLRQAREILEAAENPEDDGDNRWYIAMSARQRRDLLATTEVTSADFASVKALVQGQINQFMGFTFLKSERLTKVSNDRYVPAWRKASMKLCVSETGRAFVDILPGKRHTTQVRYELDCGATRMDEKGVVRILCDES